MISMAIVFSYEDSAILTHVTFPFSFPTIMMKGWCILARLQVKLVM